MVGKFGTGTCNARGTWLRAWANKEKLMITNTHFYKHPQHVFTYTSSSSGRTRSQIDYVLIDRAFRSIVLDAHASPCPDLGSDHQAVHVRLDLSASSVKQRRKRKKPKTIPAGRPPANNQHFQQHVTESLQSRSQDST
eukprot:8534396-Pyramimonas_sp.AAC.1